MALSEGGSSPSSTTGSRPARPHDRSRRRAPARPYLLFPALLLLAGAGCAPTPEAEADPPARPPLSGPQAARYRMFLEMAHRLYREEAFDLAIDALESARELRADDPDLFYYLGHNYRKVKRLGAAEEALGRALELADRPEIRLELGLVYFDQFRHERAIAELRKVLAARPDHPRAVFHLAVCQYRMNRLEEAAGLLERLLEGRPGHPEAAYYLGMVRLQQGRPRRAAEWFQAELEDRPRHGPSRFNLAKALRALGEEEEARRQEGIFRRQAEEEARRARDTRQQSIHANQGLIHYDRGELEEALREFQAVLEQRPDDPQMLAYLGSTYLAMEELDRAEEVLERSRALRAGDPFTLTELGRVYVLQGRAEEAETTFLEATRANPYFSLPHYFLAGLYRSQNRLAESREAMMRFRMLESGAEKPRLPGTPP